MTMQAEPEIEEGLVEPEGQYPGEEGGGAGHEGGDPPARGKAGGRDELVDRPRRAGGQ